MAFNIQDIKSALQFGGARPSLFQVSMNVPDAIGIANKTQFSNKIQFLCNAAQLPASTIEPIEVAYFGRKIKIAGARTFTDWTITVINDEDFLLRGVFEDWMSAINGHTTNIRGNGANSSPSTYKADAVVRQYGKDNAINPIRKYKFQGIIPTEVSAIELAWATDNEIETFTVKFAYDLWELDSSPD